MVGHKNIGKAALALLFACFASTGSALELEKCNTASEVVQNWPHGGVSEYVDLGRSLITFSEGFSYEDLGWSNIQLVHCRSGETLIIRGDSEGTYAQKPKRTKEDAEALLKTYISGPQSYTFPEAQAALTAEGFDAEVSTSTEEICACKALYPRDRMGKKPYVYKSGIIENTTAGVNE